jgi:tryptophan synthase alpha chain
LKQRQSGLGLKSKLMNQIQEAFDRAHAENRAALIAYLPAGFPDKPKSIEILETILKNGADLVEVGLPYSDPLMDGPVIQQAVEISLVQKTTIDDCLDVVEQVAQANKPVLIMSYYSPIDKYGVKKFVSKFAKAKGAGVITPDLTIEEAAEWLSETEQQGVNRVFVVAPSNSKERLGRVVKEVDGFVYAASLMGVTGTRDTLSKDAQELVNKLREITSLPIAVGLGVSTPEMAKEVSRFADGVIVGSAFVRILLENPDFAVAKKLIAELTVQLRAGVTRN